MAAPFSPFRSREPGRFSGTPDSALSKRPLRLHLQQSGQHHGEYSPLADGLSLIRRIRHDWPALGMVVLTSLKNTVILRSAASGHAVGILNKTGSMDELLTAMRSASIGHAYIGQSIREAFNERRIEPKAVLRTRYLSKRESALLDGIEEQAALPAWY